MIGALDLSGIAAVIVASGATFAIIFDRLVSARNQRRMLDNQARVEPTIADTHKQVTSINGKTLVQTVDANESRRIGEIPEAERTDQEREHIATVPDVPDPPQGP